MPEKRLADAIEPLHRAERQWLPVAIQSRALAGLGRLEHAAGLIIESHLATSISGANNDAANPLLRIGRGVDRLVGWPKYDDRPDCDDQRHANAEYDEQQ